MHFDSDKLPSRKKLCPLCRKKIDSTVLNRPLKQILSRIAINFNSAVNDQETPTDESLESEVSESKQDITESLNLRKTVLDAELTSIESQKKKIDNNIARCYKNLKQMKDKKIEMQRQILNLQEITHKIACNIDKENEKCEEYRHYKKQLMSQSQLVRGAIDQIQEQLDKLEFLT